MLKRLTSAIDWFGFGWRHLQMADGCVIIPIRFTLPALTMLLPEDGADCNIGRIGLRMHSPELFDLWFAEKAAVEVDLLGQKWVSDVLLASYDLLQAVREDYDIEVIQEMAQRFEEAIRKNGLMKEESEINEDQ